MGIRVAGVGAYVPRRIVTNHELAARLETSHDWIVARTGIQERRVSAPGEGPSDMACAAARSCLERAGVDASAVDLIVVACSTPEQPQPAVACLVQEKLGIADRRCPAFDVNSVCTGFLFALSVAQGMMLADPGRFRHTLVIGADAFSKILSWDDRKMCAFFGDGAGAVLLAHDDGDDGRIQFWLGSDARGRRSTHVPAGGTGIPVDAEVLRNKANTFATDGPKVWELAVETVPRTIAGLLAEHHARRDEIALFVLQQSNLRVLEAIMQKLEVPMDRTVTTVERYGNTAAASIPITLHAAEEKGRLARGDRVVLCGFSGGLSSGAALLEW